MKLATFFLFIGCLQVSATAYSQKNAITLSLKKIPLEKAFTAIKKESGYSFLYNNEKLNGIKSSVTLNVKDATIHQVMRTCLKGLPLTYKIMDNTIIIMPVELAKLSPPSIKLSIDYVVQGTVEDKDGNPLIGVSIRVKASDRGTVSDGQGGFSLSVPDENVTLIVSYVGYATQEVQIEGRSNVSIVLQPAISSLNQLVVIGYGKVIREDLTGAVSSVKVGELSQNVSPNVSSALQGRVPGVNVESNGGAPGAGLSITIRGSSTLGNNTPLYVVDGVFLQNIDFLNPSDIENIDVLKDAAAASIYGSRAANGVIIITTKSGRKNSKPKVRITTMYGVQSIPKRISVLDGKQWTDVMKKYTSGAPDFNGINTNWQDEIFRDAPISKVNLNVSGGSSNFVYNISGGYLNQKGTIIKTKFSSANFRVKTQFEKGRVKIGETVMLAKTQGRENPGGTDQSGSVVNSSLVLPPTVPVRDTANPLGGWGRRPGFVKNLGNPVAALQSRDFTSNNFNLVADAFIEIRLFDQLKYKLNVGLTNGRSMSNQYTHPFDDGNISVLTPQLSQSSGVSSSWLVENTLSYEKKFGLHHISVVAGYTAQKDSSNVFGASGTGIPVGVYTLNGVSDNQAISGTASSVRRVSLLGRLSYNFASRYLFSASIRRDGSSIFAQENQYGIFPSVSAGWNISNEDFFKNSNIVQTINHLKIRGSWGILGNDLIAPYTTQNTIAFNTNYLQGNDLWLGAIPDGNASPVNLKWEQTKTTDLGLDANLFNSRLNFTIDIYKRKTTGVLLGVPVPPSLGITGSPVVNAGVVENRGIEVGLDYSGQSGDFKYDIGANFSAIKNEMTAITIGSGSQEFGDITKAKVGYPLGGFWLIKTGGIFESDATADAYKNKDGGPIQPNAAGGDIKFLDYDHDGQINNDDRQFAGTPFPKFTTGISGYFTWRSFDLNLLFQGTFGNEIYNRSRIWGEKMTEITNMSTAVLNAWTPDHHTNFPRFILTDPNLNAQLYSDRWLENGSYFRFRRFELGYTILKSWAQRMGIDQIRINVAAENIFTITQYKGYNPDMGDGGAPLDRGFDNGQYPLPRTVSFGVNVSF